ncbi:MAG TPA: thermonuclease family protein [Candidatus Bathyarchaeia archaeon]|nr:thermonuclease family protein [Candidatus Bathyarchaeia archaeon]
MTKKPVSQWLKWLGFFLLIPSLILNLFLFQKSQKSDQGILVIAVIDGDTFVLDGKTKLRLRHLDAPELEYCGGQEAKEFLEDLVLNKKVIIQEKILAQSGGRPMALVYIGDKLVNEEVLRAGWGRYHSDKSSQKDFLKSAADLAKENQLGIFSPKCYQTENPDNPDCLIKANIDKNSDRRNYYFPGCSQYDFTIVEKDLGEGWFCTEKDAQEAGFTRSKTCFDKKYNP